MDTMSEEPFSESPLSAYHLYCRFPKSLAYVVTPYDWSRVISTTPQNSVYYVTPSGRVLRSADEVNTYLRQSSACHCYLDGDLHFDDVFNFDATIHSLATGWLLPNSPPSKCMQSMARLSGRKMKAIKAQIGAEMDAKKIQDDGGSDATEADGFLVLDDGRVYQKNLSDTQWMHLIAEWKATRQGVEPAMATDANTPKPNLTEIIQVSSDSDTDEAKADKVLGKVQLAATSSKRRGPESPNGSAKKRKSIENVVTTRRYRMKPVKCTEDDKCGIWLENSHKLYQHLATVHHIQPYQCHADGCTERFSTKVKLGGHLALQHGATTQWNCPTCTQTFMDRKRLGLHITMMHSLGQFRCPTSKCEKIINTRSELLSHVKICQLRQ